jgi:hypothetical protein
MERARGSTASSPPSAPTTAAVAALREARSCFDEGGIRMLFRVTEAAARPMVYSRRQPSGTRVELLRSTAALVIMDREAAGSGGCSSTFHGRLGAGVTISIDAVPAVFRTGLIAQHRICSKLFSGCGGVQGNSTLHSRTAAAAAPHRDQAVQHVYERFVLRPACDDLDGGLFDLDDRHCYCCMQFFGGAGGSCSCKVDGRVRCAACSYQVHGKGARWPAPRVRHRAPQRPLQWLHWVHCAR